MSRGSRMVRGGVTRQATKMIDAMRAEPLPEDRAERAVEVARRSMVTAAWKDQRSPQHKRQYATAISAYERLVVLHLGRVHGYEIKTERLYGTTRFLSPEGEVLHRLSDVHARFHDEEEEGR